MKAKSLVASVSAFEIALRENGADQSADVAAELAASLGQNGNVNVSELIESTNTEGAVEPTGASAEAAAAVVKSLAQLLGPLAKKDLTTGLRELSEVLERLGPVLLKNLGQVKKVVSASRSRTRRGTAPVDHAVIDTYLGRLQAALGDEAAFTALFRELDSDPRVTKQEAVVIADRFMGPVSASTSRPKALQRVLFRHRKLMGFTSGSESIGGKAA